VPDRGPAEAEEEMTEHPDEQRKEAGGHAEAEQTGDREHAQKTNRRHQSDKRSSYRKRIPVPFHLKKHIGLERFKDVEINIVECKDWNDPCVVTIEGQEETVNSACEQIRESCLHEYRGPDDTVEIHVAKGCLSEKELKSKIEKNLRVKLKFRTSEEAYDSVIVVGRPFHTKEASDIVVEAARLHRQHECKEAA